jgi:acid phosphatase (class A)
MGSGGFGSGWFGSGWFGSGWFGSGWSDAAAGGGEVPTFPVRDDAPLAATPVPPNYNAKFRESEWDSDLLALTIMPQFLSVTNPPAALPFPTNSPGPPLNLNPPNPAAAGPWHQSAIAALQAAGGPTTPITSAMIDRLRLLAVTDRPEAMGEILQEHNNFQVRYLHLLNITAASHPKTILQMKLAARVGEFAMMYLKRLDTTHAPIAPWNLRERPRPSQVCSTLFPPVPVPGHSTYPAGHALIAWLTTTCLKDIPALNAPPYNVSLDILAERIGTNRMIAGLHFEEDVLHGKRVGIILHRYIAQCQIYQDTRAAALNEWM